MAKDTQACKEKESRVCNINIRQVEFKEKSMIMLRYKIHNENTFHSSLYTKQYCITINKVKIVGNKRINYLKRETKGRL